jgi:hypothetical protein
MVPPRPPSQEKILGVMRDFGLPIMSADVGRVAS